MENILQFDKKNLLDRMQALLPHHRTVFAAACAGRMEAAYERFTRVTGRGDFAISEKAKVTLVLGHPLIQAELHRQLHNLDELAVEPVDVERFRDRSVLESKIFIP